MARLTKATKPKLPFTDTRRRHADPPVLWLAVATGSVVFHLLLAVIILPLQAQRAGEALQLDPVAIDLVEVDPSVDLSGEAPVAIAPNATQSGVVAQQPELQPSPPDQSIEAFPSPPPEPEPAPEPPPEPLVEPPIEPPVEEPSAPVPPSPTESEQPTDSSTENPETIPPDAGQVTGADDATTAPAPADDSVVAGGGNADPTSPTGDSGLPGVTVDSNVNPTSLAISPIISQRPDRPFDVPTQLATVKPGRDRLPDPASFGCPVEPGMEAQMTEQEQYAQYLAEAAPFLNTPVNINVTVEANGQVSEASVGSEASDSYAYNQLAVCLVTNWLEFNPALRDGVPWASDNQQVTIIISSIQ